MRTEDFIRAHKTRFEEPLPPDIWKKLKRQIPEKKLPKWHRVSWRIVASITIFLALGLVLGYKLGISPSQKELFSSFKNKSTPAYLVGFAEEVEQKSNALLYLKSENPDLHEVFLMDLNILQKNYENMHNQLATHPNKKQLLNAMKENLEWQIELLNKQTEVAENINKKTWL
jgi:hypothetical protein